MYLFLKPFFFPLNKHIVNNDYEKSVFSSHFTFTAQLEGSVLIGLHVLWYKITMEILCYTDAGLFKISRQYLPKKGTSSPSVVPNFQSIRNRKGVLSPARFNHSSTSAPMGTVRLNTPGKASLRSGVSPTLQNLGICCIHQCF